MRNRVLFIGHSAYRAGAQLSLLNFIKWAKTNAGFDIDVLLAEGGELVPEYAQFATTLVVEKPGGSERAIRRIARLLHLSYPEKPILDASQYDLVYSNTITTGHLLSRLAHLECPVVTHVRELGCWISRSGGDNIDCVKRRTTRYIAVSKAVRDNLIENHAIPGDLIDVIHGFIPVDEIRAKPVSRGAIRVPLGIPEDAIVVGACGTEPWIKGLDLFVRVAYEALKAGPESKLYFVWVGIDASALGSHELLFDLRRAIPSDRVRIVPPTNAPWQYYASFDIFALTSREDSFPRVNLEAALFGVPIVCFDQAGGSPEFVEDDAGYVVPYYDVGAMAEKIGLLARIDELRKSLGARARHKVMERHDVPVGSRKILGVFEKLMVK